jgi:hypothetical protein
VGEAEPGRAPSAPLLVQCWRELSAASEAPRPLQAGACPVDSLPPVLRADVPGGMGPPSPSVHRPQASDRLLVIARQVSGASPSAAGAHPRGVRRSVLQTLTTRPLAVVAPLQAALDRPARDILHAPFPPLVPSSSP